MTVWQRASSGAVCFLPTSALRPLLLIESLLLIWTASEADEWAGQVAFLPL